MIGHVAARAYLERDLPTATLLHGPKSVGKWTLANYLADYHQVRKVDRWAVPQGLTIDTVRLVTAYAARAPVGAFKLVVARLDSSSRQALNALLKTLEEPPPRVKFLLVSASHTLPTVSSRCTVFELGILTPAELEHIYREQGIPLNKARQAATHAKGQVARGYEYESIDAPKSLVVSLARALSTSDTELFDSVFKGWDARATELLSALFTECLTRRWQVFTPAEAAGLPHDRLRLWRMVSAIGKLHAARPRLGVRAALEPFLART